MEGGYSIVEKKYEVLIHPYHSLVWVFCNCGSAVAIFGPARMMPYRRSVTQSFHVPPNYHVDAAPELTPTRSVDVERCWLTTVISVITSHCSTKSGWGLKSWRMTLGDGAGRNVNFDNSRFVQYIYQCDELIRKMEENQPWVMVIGAPVQWW